MQVSITTIIFSTLVILLTLFKLYSIKKKGLKDFFKSFLTKKLIVLPIIALIYGVFMLINPDVEIQNPKTILTEYISSVTQ
jgi:F0F1-type ATP synthase membrane subunit a